MLIPLLLTLSLQPSPSITTTQGQTLALSGRPATVLVFVTTTCPIARSMQPVLKRLHQTYAPKNVQFISVHVDPTLTKSQIQTYVKDFELPWPQTVDKSHRLVNLYKATITPEAVLLDKSAQVVYQGRINNSYPEIGVKKDPTTHDLQDALAATLAGKPVKNPKTKPVGCIIPALADY